MENEDRPLADIFNEIFRNLKRAENDEEGIDLKKNAAQSLSLKMKVQSLGTFSPNESIDEVSNKSLKYFLCAYFEGYFRLKMHDSEPALKTNEAVTRCFLEFLKNLNDYDIKRKVQVTSDPRQARIEAHKRKKALEENLKKFEKEQKEDSIDEELERKYWLENIELYEDKANSSMESLKREIPFLKMRESGVKPEKPREPPVKTKPMIIAKNEQMKKVLGLGYPSAPIYTVEEFGDRQVEIMQKQAKEKAAWEAQQPTVDPYREMTEQEEEIQRRKDQRMDEHRDYVRRGDGNRKNMG